MGRLDPGPPPKRHHLVRMGPLHQPPITPIIMIAPWARQLAHKSGCTFLAFFGLDPAAERISLKKEGDPRILPNNDRRIFVSSD